MENPFGKSKFTLRFDQMNIFVLTLNRIPFFRVHIDLSSPTLIVIQCYQSLEFLKISLRLPLLERQDWKEGFQAHEH